VRSLPAPSPELNFCIDRIVANEKRVFGWGWVAHAKTAVKSVTLVIENSEQNQCIDANFGLTREDVNQAFPDLPYGLESGYVITGFLTSSEFQQLYFEIEMVDGSKETISAMEQLEQKSHSQRKSRGRAWLANAVWRRLKNGDIKGIWQRAMSQNFGAPQADESSLRARVQSSLTDSQQCSLVLDHNLGGGANHYRRDAIKHKLTAGKTVLLCTYNLPTLDYRLHIYAPDAEEEIIRIDSFASLTPLIKEKVITEILVNSPVSFDEPLFLAEWLTRIRKDYDHVNLTMAIHDYFPVCPSFVLLDWEGHYCGIPDISKCAHCLSNHTASYTKLTPPTEMGPWRAIWKNCLLVADEIRCFSSSTRTLLLKAYPDLESRNITLVPHKVDYLPVRKPTINPTAPLVIGIIGQLSVQKGAEIVKDLLALIDSQGLPIRVVVIGALDIPVKSTNLTVTGPYERDKLVPLIEQHQANMFLFPSICPETFSYVTEEMILLSLPFVAFNLGAPAERLKNYEHGRICAEIHAEAALDTLREFYTERASKNSVPLNIQEAN